MKSTILAENTAYNFSDYFKLVDYLEDILAYFGYAFAKQHYELTRHLEPLASLAELQARLTRNLPYLSLTNEAAKREFLIAPILLELVDYTHAKIKVEFPLTVNDQLKGTLDYYLQSHQNLLRKGLISRRRSLAALKMLKVRLEWRSSIKFSRY